MMPDLIDELRELDPVRDLRLPVEGEGLRELRSAVLASPRPVSSGRPLRWLGAALAAAAMLVGAYLLWPGVTTPSTVPAAPAASPPVTIPAEPGAWHRTAAPPLSPRRDSVTAWAGGSFFVIGGDESPTCRASADCVWSEQPVRDGARYDPATDTWSSIASAPIDMVNSPANPYQRVAVVERTLFVAQGEDVLAYDIDADTWRTLRRPVGTLISNLVALDGSLIAFDSLQTGHATDSYLRFDIDRSRWIVYDLEQPLPGPVEGAAAVDGYLVMSGTGTAGSAWVATMNGIAGPIEVEDVAIDGRMAPVAVQTSVGGFAVWPRGDAAAWFYRPSADALWSVPQPATRGPFTGTAQPDVLVSWYVTPAGMVALNGQLFDPATRLWSPVPELPVPSGNPVLASGGDYVLACFGRDDTKFGDECHLLRPAPASEPEPKR